MTLKITSKSLKHMIMHWHMSSTWPVYDLNVVFKYRYWAFPFVLVFTYYGFCFAYDKKKRSGHVSLFMDHLSVVCEDFLYLLISWTE